ncbi:MAG: serine hydrolase, partial [Clostridia bacterium]
MDLKFQTNTVKLLFNMFDRKTVTTSVIKYTPQKVVFMPSEVKDETRLPRVKAESVGISPIRLQNYFKDIGNDSMAMAHTVIVAKDGCIVGGKNYSPYSSKMWHITYSMCKTITGLAIGMLIDEGRLSIDDKIFKIFDKKLPLTVNLRLFSLTIRHLLTMQSGVTFNEAGSVTDENWYESFMTSQLLFEPGKGFMYNSMNSYMLAVIIKEITNESLTDYLKSHLFDPMGIKRFYWEKSPSGIEKGGWGLYLLPEDMVKLGLLIYNGGVWEGKALISREWITAATTNQVKVPEYVGKYGYGYQMWVGENPRQAMFNGMFGQNIVIYLDSGVVVAITAGNSDIFQTNNFFKYSESYWGDSNDLINDKANKPIGLSSKDNTVKYKLSKIKEETQIPAKWKAINSKVYVLNDRQSKSVGLMPLALQAMQNNFSKGIEEISLTFVNENCAIKIKEGDVIYTLPIGIDKPIRSELDINGEKYAVEVEGVFTKNEDYVPVLKLKICFIEMANVRFIKIFLYNESINTQWSETPGVEFITNGIQLFFSIIKTNKLYNAVASKIDTDYFKKRMKILFEPDVEGELKKLSLTADKNIELKEIVKIKKSDSV